MGLLNRSKGHDGSYASRAALPSWIAASPDPCDLLIVRAGRPAAAAAGRFTPPRAGGLDGQTFEIEVAAGTDSGRPMFTRGYVTITKLVTPADPHALAA